MKDDVVKTKRLLLRPSRMSDAESLYAVLGDPGTMQFTEPVASVEDCARRLEATQRECEAAGFSIWTVLRSEDREVIGWGGLCIDPFDRRWGPEVVYYFRRDAWGRGYATEVTEAALRYAVKVGLKEVLAFANPENTASQAVLQKTGFVEQRYIEDMNRNLYRWLAAQ